ncbi:MAG: hypothetical protein WAO95_17525 [Burkholderiales bacterium]
MNRFLKDFALLGFCVLSAGAFSASHLPPESSSQLGVTVKVTPLNLAGPFWEFAVVFDTHSQDLK